jgi:hypothetical protein
LLAPHPVHLLGAGLELVLHGQGNFKGEWAHGLHQQIADGAVECTAHNALANNLRVLDAAPTGLKIIRRYFRTEALIKLTNSAEVMPHPLLATS